MAILRNYDRRELVYFAMRLRPFSRGVCMVWGWMSSSLHRTQVADVIDDPDSLASPPAASSRRVSPYVAAPVILSCILVGYAISLVRPLHPDPAGGQPTADLNALVAASSGPTEGPITVAHTATANDLPAHPGQSEPVVAPIPTPVPTPKVETGSVHRPPEPAQKAEANETVAPSALEAQKVASPPGAARRIVQRRPRRVYYRRPQQQASQQWPVEAFFSSLVK